MLFIKKGNLHAKKTITEGTPRHPKKHFLRWLYTGVALLFRTAVIAVGKQGYVNEARNITTPETVCCRRQSDRCLVEPWY